MKQKQTNKIPQIHILFHREFALYGTERWPCDDSTSIELVCFADGKKEEDLWASVGQIIFYSHVWKIRRQK